MKTIVAISLTTLSLAFSAAALAAPDSGACAAAPSPVQSDSRLGWLALRSAHPLSAQAQDALRATPCDPAPAADGYVDRRDERRLALRGDSRIGWLALHGAHPLSAAAEASLTQ